MIEGHWLILFVLFVLNGWIGYHRGVYVQRRRMVVRPPLKTREPEEVIHW